METLAGTGVAGSDDGAADTATFRNPQGVALDSRGNLWVVDTGNHTIRRMDLATGEVRTIAGKAGSAGFIDARAEEARFSSPVGIAIETDVVTVSFLDTTPKSVSVLIADRGNGAIRRVKETGEVETVASRDATAPTGDREGHLGRVAAATPITFSAPTGVAVDPFGNIYVTEPTRSRLRVILGNGEVVAATEGGTFESPNGVVVTQSGELVVADESGSPQQISYGEPEIDSISPDKVNAKGGEELTIKGNNFASDTVVVIAGIIISNVNIIDTQTLTFITPVLPSGITTLTVQNRGGLAQAPLLVEPASSFSSLPAGYITTVAGGTTFAGDGGHATAAELDFPFAVAVDALGSLFVADTLNHRIRRVDAITGVITTVAGSGQFGFSGDDGKATAAELADPREIALDTSGNLFIADEFNDRIRRVDAITGIITTVAGNGVRGFSGDDGPATDAQLNRPLGLALDTQGNLFIGDRRNDRIRRVDATTGIITTVAGTERGFFGDNGPATAAQLNRPAGIAVDASGNLFIGDEFNNRIRRVDAASGVISTVAGTDEGGFSGDDAPATAARLNRPVGVAVDASENLFIADRENNRIRRVDAITGAITTEAGTDEAGFSGDDGPATAARLNRPTGVAVDTSGNLFIADFDNDRIRRVDATPVDLGFGVRRRFINTVAGTGEKGFIGDDGPATAAQLEFPRGIALDPLGNLFIADTVNHRIRKVDATTGVITTVAGIGERGFFGDNGPATAAQIEFPRRIAFDSVGNLFISDRVNNRIRRVDAATGIITTVVGTDEQGFAGDGGLATAAQLSRPEGIVLDTLDNLFIADRENNRIRRVDAITGVITTEAGTDEQGFAGDGGPATAAQLNRPAGIALDTSGNLFIADFGNDRIRRVDAATGIITTVAGTEARGFFGDNGPATEAQLWLPVGVALDTLGNLFIADFGNDRVRRVDAATGIITTVAGTDEDGFSGDDGLAIDAQINLPTGIAVDPSGNVFFADTLNSRIRVVRGPNPYITPDKVSAKGGQEVTIGGSNFGSDTVVVIAGVIIANVNIIDTQTLNFITPVLPSGITTLTVQNRDGLAQAPFLVEAASLSSLPAGYITTVAGGTTFAGDGGDATAAELDFPFSVAMDALENLFIADGFNHRIRRVDAVTGVISTVAGSGQLGFAGDNGPATAAQLNRPAGIAVDTSGNLFIADEFNHRIRRVDATTAIITTVAGTDEQGYSGDDGPATAAQLNRPRGITVDASGNLFIADFDNDRIRRVDTTTGIITTVAGTDERGFFGDNGPATAAQLNRPAGIAVNASGNLFIGDEFNDRIRRVDAATGVITTVAGTDEGGFSGDDAPATEAQLNRPVGVVVDASGNLFIADRENNRIRRVDAITGVITTEAGTDEVGFSGDDGPATGALLNRPTGIALDTSGDLFIADFDNDRIRRVDATTSIINTVAGTGEKGFIGDDGPATAAQLEFPRGIALDALGNLFIADTVNHLIRRVDATTGVIATVAGIGERGFFGDNGPATAAQIEFPRQVAFDSGGNLFIADRVYNRIRRVDATTGIITTVAGTDEGFAGDGGLATAAQLSRPEGIELDASDNVFLVDSDNNRIRRVDAATGIITTVAGTDEGGFSGDDGPATAAQLNGPVGIALDTSGNLFIADFDNDRIRRVDAATGIITTVAGTDERGFSGDNGPATDARLSRPFAVALDTSGNLFIADFDNDRIRRVDAATGIVTTVAGTDEEGFSGDDAPATEAQLNLPTGIAMDASGNLFMADTLNSRIRVVRGPIP